MCYTPRMSHRAFRHFSQQISRPLHPSWIFYAAVWGIIAGIVYGAASSSILLPHFSLLLICVLCFLFCLKFPCRLTTVIVFLAGFLAGNFRLLPQLAGQTTITPHYGASVIISGILTEDPDTNKGTTVIRLGQLQLHPPPDDSLDNPLTLRNSSASLPISGILYASLSSANYDLERSDLVILQGKLGDNFGTFIGSMYRPQLLAIERSDPGDIFAQFKHWFSDRVREFIPSPEVDLGLGYLMGMKSGLSEDFSEAFRAVGMTHVVVASGAHLAILIGAAKKLFGKISKFAGLLFSLLMIAAFVMIVGFTPSMTRAALVASLSLLAGYVGRKFSPLRLIGFVAMITLLIEPTNLLNLGWQLSFASFFGILVVAPYLQKILYGGKTPPWLASMFITSTATSLICAPILIFNFGSLSFLSLVANLIILPTLPYAMLGMMLTGATGMLPLLPNIISRLTAWLLDLHIWLVNFLSQQTTFIINLPSADSRIFFIYLPLSLFLIYPTLRQYLYHRRHPTSVTHIPEAILVVSR